MYYFYNEEKGVKRGNIWGKIQKKSITITKNMI